MTQNAPTNDPRLKAEPTAAVGIIRCTGPRESILLLRRARSIEDPWSGHYAFPGGRREVHDSTLYDTCIREVLEETGIQLDRSSLSLSLPPALAGRTVRAPVLVQPYLFDIATQPEVVVEESEIESFVWLEVAKFRDQAMHFSAEALPGKTRPAFPVGDYYIWGFTYQLLCAVTDVPSDS